MKRLTLAALVAGGWLLGGLGGVGLGENILVNPDLSQDNGAGIPTGWFYKLAVRSPSDIRAKALEDKSAEIAYTGTEVLFLAQNHLKLKAGGKYRISAEFKTDGKAKYNVWIWNHNWGGEWQSPKIPLNATSEWVKVEWMPKIPACVQSNNYSLGIGANPPTQGAKLKFRNLCFEALDAETAAETERVAAKWLVPKWRIVPISTVLDDFPATTGALTCYWAGEPKGGVTAAKLTGDIDGKWSASAAFDEKGRAQLKFGKVAGGNHQLKLTVRDKDGAVLAADEYKIYARYPVSGPKGKKLNNFVTQLVNQPLVDGEVKFFVPEDGWVWFALDGAGSEGATGDLDQYQFPIVHRRGEERELENQRYLKAGWHALAVKGAKGGRLRIHAVKTLMVMAFDAGTMQSAALTLRFAERFHGLSTFNSFCGANELYHGGLTTRPDVGYYLERGLHIAQSLPYFVSAKDAQRMDADAAYARICRDLPVETPYSLLNENAMSAPYESILAYSEALWRLRRERPMAELGTFIYDPAGKVWYNRPKFHTSEIAAMINQGRGKSKLYLEVYTPTASDEAVVAKYETEYYPRILKSAHELVPAAKGHLNLFMATCFRMGGWTSYISPEVDFKAHMVKMLRAYATMSEYADNGGCALYGSNSCDEELQRWGFKCIHYYCVEGGTDDLLETYGYKWKPGFVKNCDFAEGLKGWTVQAAATDSVKAETIKKFGRNVQKRQAEHFPGVGDSVAVITSSATAPNEISQTITGLTPGEYYTLFFVTVDRDAVDKPSDRLDAGKFSARLEGASEVVGLRHVEICPTIKAQKVATRTWEHKYVFKAEAPMAKLVITDRADDGSAPKAGTRTALNYILFRPYYLERGDTVEDVITRLKLK